MTLDDLKARIERIEEAYEFCLAYAAQGLSGDAVAGGTGGQAREFLRRFDGALDGLADGFRAHLPDAAGHEAAVAVLERDAAATQALLRLALAQAALSSQLVDNLNASIHVRALLTDVFFLGDLVG